MRSQGEKATWIDSVGLEFRKLLDSLGMKRPGLSYYALRHSFETHAGESRDPHAVSSIMGHAPAAGDMSAVYRERISDERLQAVTEHVRRMVFPSKASKKKSTLKVKGRKLKVVG